MISSTSVDFQPWSQLLEHHYIHYRTVHCCPAPLLMSLITIFRIILTILFANARGPNEFDHESQVGGSLSRSIRQGSTAKVQPNRKRPVTVIVVAVLFALITC